MSVADARRKLKREIAALNRTYAENANRGCQPPEDWPYYERQVELATRRVDKAIAALITQAEQT